MRLKTLRIENFRSVLSAEIDFDQRVTFLFGPNGVAKTTIADAIEFVLSGRCVRGTDNGGKGAKVLVRDYGKQGAAKGFSLSLLLEDRELVRSVSAAGNGQVTGVVPPVNPGILRILTQGTALLDPKITPDAEAQAILLDALNVTVAVHGEKLTLAQSKGKFKQAYDDRTVAKRVLDAIYVPDMPEGELPPDDLAQRVEALRAKERELYAEQRETSAADRGRAADLSTQLAQARQRIDVVKAKVARANYPKDLEAQIATLTATVETPAFDEKALEVQRAFLSDLAVREAPLLQALEAIGAHDAQKGEDRTCSLPGGETIPCMTRATLFKAHAGKLRILTGDIAKQRKAADEKIADLKAAAELRDRQRAQLDGLKELLAGKVAMQQALENTQADVPGLETKLAACENQPTGSAVESAALTELREKIVRGEKLLERAATIRATIATRNERLREREAQQKVVDELEAEVALLGPKGAPAQALDKALGRFEAEVNSQLAGFNLPPLHFSIDPWVVYVNGVAATLLSETELIRAGIALQMALADLTGLGFVVIDRVDHFDRRNTRLFMQLVYEWQGQVIAMLTREEDYQPAPRPGTAYYRMTRDFERFGPTSIERVGAAVEV